MKNLLAFLLFTAAAFPQGRIQSPTRQVAQFGALEDRVFSSIVHADAKALGDLLADDFALRTARSGGDTIGRDEYMKQRLNDHDLRSYQVRRIDVRDFGEIAVVNFLYHQEAISGGKDLSGDFFITDVWRKSAAGWKLAVRYSAGPGIGITTDKRPTGKE
jgi:hypothetical protein